MQEMFKKGVLVLNTHNVSLGLNQKLCGEVLEKYGSVLALMAQHISENTLLDNLQVKPLNPLFRIR